VVLLLLSNCVFTALSNIIYNETLNQVYLVIALFGIVLFTVMIIWFTVQLNLKNHDTLRSEYDNALLSAKLSDQNKLLESQEELHKIRHDLKHLLTLCNSADSFERDQELNEIANLYQSKVDQVFLPIQSNDPVIDRVLNIKGKEAAAKNISLTCQLNYTHPAAIEKTDLELVLSNLIDNAIEHIGLERHITVAIGIVHSSFQIRIINSIDHSVLDSDHHFKPSASSSEHGYGVDTIEQIVKEYHGSLYYCEDGFNLTAQVLLPDDEHYMSEKGKQEKDRQKPNSAGDHQ
jgi:sensor histidine kinase regulating citrate/malate metabolism